jgi:hypothetical protein
LEGKAGFADPHSVLADQASEDRQFVGGRSHCFGDHIGTGHITGLTNEQTATLAKGRNAMKEKLVDQDEATKTLARWQVERRLVEIRLRFIQGVTQTHSGYVTVEPDGRIVVASVEGRDQYFTTVFFASDFDAIRLIDSENAITFSLSRPTSPVFRAITVACRQQL